MAERYDPLGLYQNSAPKYDPLGLYGTPAQEPQKEEGLLRRAADYGLTAIKGAIGVPEAAVGLADLVTGGYAGKALEHLGFRPEEAKAFLDEHYSEAQKLSNANLEEAHGFLGKAAAAVKNPSTIAHAIVESLPAMGAGGLIGRGLVQGAKVAPWAAGAIGEGVVGGGIAAEQIRQQSDTGTLSPVQTGAALASGAGTAALGALGGKLASKFGWADIDTVIAQGGPDALAADAVKKGFLRRVAESGISEGAFEEMPQSMQEQMWQNVATDKPVMQGVAEAGAMGLVTGGVMGGVGGGFFGAKPQDISAKPQPTPNDILAAPDVDTAIQTFTDSLDGADLLNETAAPIQQREFGTLSQGATGFGQVSEFADLVAQEQKDIAQRRAELLSSQQQAAQLRLESGLESTDARVAGAREAETRAARLKLLDDIYTNQEERSPGMTFLAQLEANFPRNPTPTPEEKRIIANRESAQQAFKAEYPPEPSLPPELQQAIPSADRQKLITKLLSVKGNRITETGIRNKDGREFFKFKPGERENIQEAPANAKPDLRVGVPSAVDVRTATGTGGIAAPESVGLAAVDDGLASAGTQPNGVPKSEPVQPALRTGSETLESKATQEIKAPENILVKKPLKIGKSALNASVVEIASDGTVVLVSPDGERKIADKKTRIIPESKIPSSLKLETYQLVDGKKKKAKKSARTMMKDANQRVERYEALRVCLG